MESAYWIYVLLVLATLPPMVPNSALVAGAGAVAAAGGLSLPLLVVVLLVSTVTGDLGVFWAGRRAGARVAHWLRRRPRRRSTLEWTSERLGRYGVPAVIAVRFVPGGRGVGALTAGAVGYPVRSYLLGAAIAESLFVSYTVGLGYLGGRLAMGGVARWLVGPAVSLLVAGVVLGVQRIVGRPPGGPDAEEEGSDAAPDSEALPEPGPGRASGAGTAPAPDPGAEPEAGPGPEP